MPDDLHEEGSPATNVCILEQLKFLTSDAYKSGKIKGVAAGYNRGRAPSHRESTACGASPQEKRHPNLDASFLCGDRRIRTDDPLLAKQVL